MIDEPVTQEQAARLNRVINVYPPVPALFAVLTQTPGWAHLDYEEARCVLEDESPLRELGFPEGSLFNNYAARVLGDEFARAHNGRVEVNRHAFNSLRVAVYEAQRAFSEHLQRLSMLSGTEAGRLPPPTAGGEGVAPDA